MIIDKLRNISSYNGYSKNMEKAVRFIETVDFDRLEEGKIEIDGENCYAVVKEYETKIPEDCKWEAHRKYIDIHIVYDGCENIGYADINNLKSLNNYNETDDIYFLEGQGNIFTCMPGSFALFAPEDGHKPSLACENPIAVKKLVIKVKV